jgi:hypothetical protein
LKANFKGAILAELGTDTSRVCSLLGGDKKRRKGNIHSSFVCFIFLFFKAEHSFTGNDYAIICLPVTFIMQGNRNGWNRWVRLAFNN